MEMRKLIVFLITLGISWAPMDAANENPESPESAASDKTVRIHGMLKPYREVRLASRAKGVIAEIQEEGSRLKEGETAMRLENAMEKLQVDQQRKIVEMRVVEDEASSALGKSAAISRLEATEKSINLDIARILLAQAEEMLDRRSVASPFEGVVTERLRSAGEAVDEFVPVMTLVDISRLYFEAFLPARLVGVVEPGQKVTIEIPLFPGETFEGTIEMVSPVVNPASSEFKIKAAIDNSDGRLSAGLTAFCKVPDSSSSDG
jgi:membrane fusion protein (multidrug efflux system)